MRMRAVCVSAMLVVIIISAVVVIVVRVFIRPVTLLKTIRCPGPPPHHRKCDDANEHDSRDDENAC